MHIEELSQALVRDPDGIYRAGPAQRVSYAEDGHQSCFQVEDSSFWFRHRNDCIASMIANHPFRGAMLDIGGGNGFVARRLSDEGWDVVLLEPGEVGAGNARRGRRLEQVVCATVETAAFRRGCFGAIGMFDVIEHIERDRDFLERAIELLEEGDRLYLTVPCHQWLWSQSDVRSGHYRRYTEKSLRNLLEGLFRIDYLSYYFQPLVVPQFAFRALPERLGIRRRRLLSADVEHGSNNGLAARMIASLLRTEHRRVARNERLGFGASCLVAASRT